MSGTLIAFLYEKRFKNKVDLIITSRFQAWSVVSDSINWNYNWSDMKDLVSKQQTPKFIAS